MIRSKTAVARGTPSCASGKIGIEKSRVGWLRKVVRVGQRRYVRTGFNNLVCFLLVEPSCASWLIGVRRATAFSASATTSADSYLVGNLTQPVGGAANGPGPQRAKTRDELATDSGCQEPLMAGSTNAIALVLMDPSGYDSS